MRVERVFLGWDRLPLHAAHEWLTGQAQRLGPSMDLSRFAICLPTSRGGRLLQNVLVDAAGTSGGALIPPTFFTPGSLLESLHRAADAASPRADPRTPASPIAIRLAWRITLDALSPAELRSLTGGMEFDDNEPLAIASLVARSHSRLTSNLSSFRAAFERGRMIQGGIMEPRLAALAKAERTYAEVLHAAGLADPLLARALDGDQKSEAAAPKAWQRLVLIGMLEIPIPLRRALEHAATDSIEVTSLIFAPSSQAAMHDELGGVSPDVWHESKIDLGTSSVTVVEKGEDLVDAALEIVSNLPANTSTHDVAMGVTDSTLTPLLVRHASQCGLRVRPGTGNPIERTPTALLLRSVLDLNREKTFREWGTLLRHPWFERALLTTINPDVPPAAEHWLEALDHYVIEHLPRRLTRHFVAEGDVLLPVLDATTTLLGDLAPLLEGDRGPGTGRRTLSSWCEGIGSFLDRVVPEPPEDDPASQSEADAFNSALESMSALSGAPSLDRETTADVALSALLELASSATIPPPEVDDAVEAIGWLELPLDPAPHVIVLGLNEGVVPSREAPDPFLPPTLLRALGVDTSATRVARDAAILTQLAHSRSLHILASRSGQDGEPQLPSRLLFMADDDTLHARARLWSPAKGTPAPTIARPPRRPTRSTSAFQAMCAPPLHIPERWSVTSFRDYLSSPYLFYLRHIANVQELDESSPELLPHRFGTLVHAVLAGFGQSDERSMRDGSRLRAVLQRRFESLLETVFGPSLSAPLWVQSQQALDRLRGFAEWQAARVDEGWSIAHAEWFPGRAGVPFAWAKGEIRLAGRIDRIDTHPDGRIALIDYKLRENSKTPDQTHRKNDAWVDLQLPLYRHLAASILQGHSPVLAYVTLAADGTTKEQQASWDEAMLDSADQTARSVIAAVHAGEFQKQGTTPPPGHIASALAGIGHLGAIEHAEESAEEEDQ